MTIFLRFEGDRVKQATFRTTGSATGSLCCFFAAKLAIEKTSEEIGEITGETVIQFMSGLPEKDRQSAFSPGTGDSPQVSNEPPKCEAENHGNLILH
jgi:nitrogen fixation NifU-like protein